ncbi:MAG: hypothetical protein JJE30_03090 [Desulfuromonadales bacterium]|nr:hypothetical protein [Desulfuromonadales bacterium]
MKPRLLIVMTLMAALPCMSGCSFPGWKVFSVKPAGVASAPVEVPVAREQERSFANALEFLRTGREQDARIALEQFIAGPQRSGVMDEAMFRLSLLYLRDEGSKGAVRALELLERLKTEFPRSLWAQQGAPLAAYLTGVRILRDRQREVKTLKELNLSLSRDNREMRQSIERLKSLDLELEQKIKR